MKRAYAASAAVIFVILTVGCNQWKQRFTKVEQRPPAASAGAPAEPTVAASEDAKGEPQASEDGAAAAVRRYLADLQAASSADAPIDVAQPSGSDASLGGGEPTGSASSDQQQPRSQTNTAVALQDVPASSDLPADAGPAPPVILAVSVIGATDAAELVVAPDEAESLGVHRGLDLVVNTEATSLHRLIDQAERRLAEDPADAGKQWQLSLLQLAAGKRDEAGRLSPAVAQESRSLISHLVSAIAAANQLMTDPLTGSEDALLAVEDLRLALRGDAALDIPVVALCTKVTTFGVYDELPAEALRAYQANRVIVYCEVENLQAKANESGKFHTQLAARLELFTGDGRSLWVHDENTIEDLSRRRREDFFLAQLITLPADLAPGDYVLKVAVTDLLAGKTNEAAHRFRIPGIRTATSPSARQ